MHNSERLLCMYKMDFMFDSDQAQINSIGPLVYDGHDLGQHCKFGSRQYQI
jgi:hypothetical protein